LPYYRKPLQTSWNPVLRQGQAKKVIQREPIRMTGHGNVAAIFGRRPQGRDGLSEPSGKRGGPQDLA